MVNHAACFPVSIDYIVTEWGQTCQDVNFPSIMDENECKSAVESLGRHYEGDRKAYTKGCSLTFTVSGGFNSHSMGSRSYNAKDITNKK